MSTLPIPRAWPRLWLGVLSRSLKVLFKYWRGRRRLLGWFDLLQDLILDLTRDIMAHQLDQHAAVVDSPYVGVDVVEREEDMRLRTQAQAIQHRQQ
jgi:hypothetical protein